MDLRPAQLVVATLCVVACSGSAGQQASSTPVVPHALEGQSCAVCGMIVREQPPPRGQVRHRDGTHHLFCSLGDMRSHLQAPSSHGAATDVWVESLPAEYVPTAPDRDALPWIDAEQSSFVVGFERARVMGVPTLSFAAATDAQAAARRVGGHVVDWSVLRTTPAHQVPPAP